MADFRPSSSASPTPGESSDASRKVIPKVIIAQRQGGQLWKKIGLVGSVAVMGGQPVLAQIDAVPVGELTTPPAIAEPAPENIAPVAPPVAEAAPVAPPVVVAPETSGPTFSTTPEVLPQVDAITSQVDVVTPESVAPVVVAPQEIATPEEAAAPVEAASPAEAEISETAPILEAPTVDIVKPSDVVPGAIPTVEDLASEYGGVFIDPTDYAVGETDTETGPAVVVSERSTGCEYQVNGKGLNNICVDGTQQPVAAAPETVSPNQAPSGGINIGPVNISRSGVRFTGSIATVASREYYNTVAKPLVDLQAGESFVFPLASASPITSLFGWRWHPIHNDYRFHNGTDLGAPQGTPILATQSGQVSVADYLGGYGLTVILRHGDNTLESRYAHMAHILVQPGEWVEQGDVIGLVGSTGNSTGPHLHFELHQLTGQGWVVINPDDVLRYALANLNNRSNGNPLAALNIIPRAEATPTKAALPKALKTETVVKEAKDTPHFRPAQPHAQ